jgi:hypothetical protein
VLASLKNIFQGFSRHLWSKSKPKMRGFDCKSARAALEAYLDDSAKLNIFKLLRAIETFAAFSGVALGLAQMAPAEYSSSCRK